jgi:hypothetical protein
MMNTSCTIYEKDMARKTGGQQGFSQGQPD